MANERDLPIGCGVLVVKDGKILCGIRSDNGLCCGPGGHIEAGEAPEKAAARETAEEFGITPKHLFSIGYLQSDSYRPSAIYVCTEYEGDPKCDGNEMITCGFLGLDELEQLDLHPAFKDSVGLLLDVLFEGKTNNDEFETDGGQGSGNWGHSGRPGERGRSAKGGGVAYRLEKQKDETGHYPWSSYHQREQKYTGLVWAYRAEEKRAAAEKAGKGKEDVDMALARGLNDAKAKKEIADKIKAKAKEKEAGKPTGGEVEKGAVSGNASSFVTGATKTGEYDLPFEQKGEKLKVTPVSERKYTPEQQARRDELEKIASEAGIHTLGPKHDKKVDAAEAKFEKKVQQAIDDYDSKPAKELLAAKDEFVSGMRKAFEEQDFVTDIGLNNAISVLDQGFFKNQLETKTTGGADAPDLRRAISNKMFGTDKGDEPQNFEKYGHLGNTYTHYGTRDPSGQVQIVFDKGRVWDKTTYTVGDSLGNMYQPCKVTDPKMCALDREPSLFGGSVDIYRKDVKQMVSKGTPKSAPYCELQYHGIITTNDISHIRIPASLHGSPKVKELVAKAGGLGVPVIWEDSAPSRY